MQVGVCYGPGDIRVEDRPIYKVQNSEDPVLDFWSGYFKELDLLWVSSYAKWGGKPEFEIGIDLLALGKCDAKPLVTHKFPLDKITDGFEALLNKKESPQQILQ